MEATYPQSITGPVLGSRKGTYTGYDINVASGSRNVVSADLARGYVLQRDPFNWLATPDNMEFARPTYGYDTYFGIVGENTVPGFASLNAIDTGIANKRVGGKVEILTAGRVQAYVKANCVKGVTQLAPVADQFYLGPVFQPGILACATAASTAVSNTASETALDNSACTIPANSLRPGDVIKIKTQGIATATNAADTLTINVKLGSATLYQFAANDVVNNDIWNGEVTMVVRSIGASGSAVVDVIGTLDVDADKDPAIASFKAATTIDTTGDLAITVTATWSAASSSNSCRADIFIVTLQRQPTPFGQTIAIADETSDKSSTAGLVWVALKHQYGAY